MSWYVLPDRHHQSREDYRNPSSTATPRVNHQERQRKILRLQRNSARNMLYGGMFAIANGLFTLLFNTVLRNYMIIMHGIRVFKSLAAGTYCLTALSLLFLVLGLVQRFYARHLQRQEAQQDVSRVEHRLRDLIDYSKDSTSPELTRKWLEQVRTDTPAFDGLITRCLTQMDTMDNLQSRQNTLIVGNDARYLRDTTAVLDNVERRLCQNLRNVINLCIATDSDQALNLKQVNHILDANGQLLSDARALLQASAEWINQYNSGTACDSSEVANWLKVIRDSLEEDSE